MTREQAKALLISLGIEAPSDEQVTNYLNSVNGEVQKEKDKSKDYKAKADTADELQRQLDEINEKGLTDLEKANKAIEASNKTIADLTKQVNMSEVKAILSQGGLTEEDYKDFIGGIVTGDLETSKTLATNLISVFSKQKQAAEAKVKEELLKDTPGGNGGDGGGSEKSISEKIAEGLAKSNAVSDSADVINQYK